MKTAEAVRAQIRLMEEIGKAGLVTAGKDISNPGIIGTLGMLLEVSGKGATIELDAIPRPDLAAHGMTFEQWVKMYPGMGFILTAREEHVGELMRRFAEVGMTACAIGTVDDSNELTVTYKGGDESRVFDFSRNGVMRLFFPSPSCGCK
jgi:selenophosphate synthetase-related protein